MSQSMTDHFQRNHLLDQVGYTFEAIVRQDTDSRNLPDGPVNR
jgi:hypothetical protein